MKNKNKQAKLKIRTQAGSDRWHDAGTEITIIDERGSYTRCKKGSRVFSVLRAFLEMMEESKTQKQR